MNTLQQLFAQRAASTPTSRGALIKDALKSWMVNGVAGYLAVQSLNQIGSHATFVLTLAEKKRRSVRLAKTVDGSMSENRMLPMKLTFKKNCLATAAALVFIFAPSIVMSADSYYGFYPSDYGQGWKQLQHNIFGVSIDIPSTWAFGIAGAAPYSVIMLYSDDLDTSSLSKAYGTVTIGILPFEDISLSEGAEATLVGMRQKHGQLNVKTQPTQKPFGSLESIQFHFSWPSSSGYEVEEKVTLVKKDSKIYSVTIRAVSEALAQNGALYKKVTKSFKPLNTKL